MVAGAELTAIDPHAPAPTPAAEVGSAAPWWREPRSWAVLIPLLLWAVPFTHATGGRDPYVVTWALLALVPGLVLVAPWRHLARLDLVALAPAAAALALCVVGRTGFDGASTVASLGLAGLLYVLIRGFLAGGGSATLVVAAVLVGGLDQFVASWWPWYGRGDSAALMVGTFYWHNQFAVFLAATGIVGGVVAARGSGRLRLLAASVAVVTVPALAFAGSRSTLAVFVLAWLAALAVSLRDRRAVVALVSLPLVGLAFTALLASPLLMTTSNSVASNVEQRETLVGNGNARLTYDRIAADLVQRRPLTGTGFGTFAGASAPLLPTNMQPTIYVHNGFAQAYVDGGVVLGTSVLVAALLPILVVGRRFWRQRLGRRGDVVDPSALGAFAGLGLLVVHSAVDVDWTYPALLALVGVLAALAVGRSAAAAEGEAGSARPTAGRNSLVAVVAAVALVVPVSVLAGASAAPAGQVPGWAQVAVLGLPVSDPPAWAEGTSLCASRLRADLAQPVRDAATASGIRHELGCLRPAAEDVPSLQMLRARGLMALGESSQARALAAEQVARHGDRIPQLLVIEAVLPADAGDVAEARRAVTAVLTDPRVAASPQAQALAQSVLDGLPASASAAAPTTRKDQ